MWYNIIFKSRRDIKMSIILNNVCVDEDGYVSTEKVVDLSSFDFQHFLHLGDAGQCTVITFQDTHSEVNSIIENAGWWFKETKEGIEEKQKLRVAVSKLRNSSQKETEAVVFISWAVECDSNIGYLTGPSEKEILEWLNRETEE
jgi:hypothetical protein